MTSVILRVVRHHAFMALVGYGLLSILIFAPVVAKLTTHILADDAIFSPGTSDAYCSLWTYWWTQKALLTNLSLFHCTWVLPPDGADLTFQATSVVPALLTIPLAQLFGTVAGYNLMVLLFITLGAWGYYLFLRHTWDIAPAAAFLTGLLFGFCPYFIVKAHAHINLINAWVWGGTLALCLDCYLHNRFTWLRSLLFALLLWAAFWTSLAEFFMLAVVLFFALAILEARAALNRTRGLMRRAAFFVPALIGAIPAGWYLMGAGTRAVSASLYDRLTLGDLLAFPKLSVLSGLAAPRSPEFWGVYLPLSVVVLAVVGVIDHRRGRPGLPMVIILAFLSLVLVLDPLGVPSGLLRSLPLGSGFRVFSRFFPFALFFLLVPAGLGLQFILSDCKPRTRAAVLTLLLTLVAVEYYPWHLNASPVKSFRVSSEQSDRLDRDRFVLVLPDGPYRHVHDTYQIAMDMRFVYLSQLTRFDSAAVMDRAARFPMVYGGQPVDDPAAFQRQLEALGVGYVLFENKARATRFPVPGSVVLETEREALLRLGGLR